MGGYRTTDLDTCREAFEEIKANGTLSLRRQEILDYLSSIDRSLTAGEVAQFLRKNRNNVATRLSEMEHLHVVRKVGEVVCTVSEKTCWTWEPTGFQVSGEIPRKVNTTEIVRMQRDSAERKAKELTKLLEKIATWLSNPERTKEDARCNVAAETIRKRIKEITGDK